jgi:GntR family transcriptional regulator
MQILIHPAVELPIYRQIVYQIQQAIRASRLRPGGKLKPFRELAEQAVVAPAMVQKAYAELECLGVIETIWTLR